MTANANYDEIEDLDSNKLHITKATLLKNQAPTGSTFCLGLTSPHAAHVKQALAMALWLRLLHSDETEMQTCDTIMDKIWKNEENDNVHKGNEVSTYNKKFLEVVIKRIGSRLLLHLLWTHHPCSKALDHKWDTMRSFFKDLSQSKCPYLFLLQN